MWEYVRPTLIKKEALFEILNFTPDKERLLLLSEKKNKTSLDIQSDIGSPLNISEE